MSAAAVLPLAREGLRLFPVKARDKRPEIADWPNQASADAERITFWAKRWPDCNWGVACGAGSGIFVIDFDDEPGRAALHQWITDHGPEWTSTRTVKTAHGGHLWFRWPEGETRIRNSTSELAPGVDVRGAGGFVVVPPSIHPNGHAYTWAAGGLTVPIADPPAWLVDLILRAAGPQQAAATSGNGSGGKIPKGRRNSTLTSLAGSMRHRGMDSEAILAALLQHNTTHCDPPLSEAEVGEIARSVGRYAAAEPSTPQLLTEDALALRFTSVYAGDARYVAAWAKWLRFNGQVWQPDLILKTHDRVRDICREAGASCTEKATVKKLQSAATVGAVERLARSDPRHAATADQWDCDLWTFNTPAGTVDLKKGDLRQHRAQDYLTKIAGAGPSGDCPLWCSFLDRVTGGDPELEAYLQRVAGYCLTGVTREHVLFFLYGTGANGKTTFTDTLLGVLGDYGQVAAMETFTENQHDRHPTEMAALRGARLVVASETEVGKRWAESRVKSLTGGDPIRARFVCCDEFEFLPQFKLMIQGNHKPGLRSVDEAIHRRFNLIPFTVTIPESERDSDLAQKLQAEWSGILRWAIHGCVEWQRIGLKPPQAVKAATAEYLAGEDSVGRWLDERAIISPQAAGTKSSVLYNDFKQWAEASGEFVGSLKRFSQDLQDRGFVVRHTMHGNCVEQVVLRDKTQGAA